MHICQAGSAGGAARAATEHQRVGNAKQRPITWQAQLHMQLLPLVQQTLLRCLQALQIIQAANIP